MMVLMGKSSINGSKSAPKKTSAPSAPARRFLPSPARAVMAPPSVLHNMIRNFAAAGAGRVSIVKTVGTVFIMICSHCYMCIQSKYNMYKYMYTYIYIYYIYIYIHYYCMILYVLSGCNHPGKKYTEHLI